MNYVFFCDERGYFFEMSETILTKNYSVMVHVMWYLNRIQFKPEVSYDVSIQMG